MNVKISVYHTCPKVNDGSFPIMTYSPTNGEFTCPKCGDTVSISATTDAN